MEESRSRAIAVVGLGAILPDAPDVASFWRNIRNGLYSISDVPAQRWDPELYYDADPKAPDKTYSKIGGWVRQWEWNPLQWGLPIPPRISDAMDDGQKWAVACARQALTDYGYPGRSLDVERTAVVLGNAMAGERHYLTALRIYFPEYARALTAGTTFKALPAEVQRQITSELHARIDECFPPITEDSMPGELSNCIAGRVANLFNLRGANYVVDAACASAMAAISTAVDGLAAGHFDAVLAGGIDRNMGATAFVKFCKIGALSATGMRPYADGADGFVMGEGAAVFLLKRLQDAERDGDRIYAVIRGVGASSDGKGKGITAPNPVGQRLAILRAWHCADQPPATATLIEGHGTSTRVGDVVEAESLTAVFGEAGAGARTVALGSVKSNIGHLKAAAGAAGLLKTVLALHEKVLPPSLHFDRPNPDIDFNHCPFYVNSELQPWPTPPCGVRRAGLSAFGFGGTNFHMVLEEHVPGSGGDGRARSTSASARVGTDHTTLKPPLRGALVLGAETEAALMARLEVVEREAAAGRVPALTAPAEADLRAAERIAIDYGDAAELGDKAAKALKALSLCHPGMWKALRAQGIFRGRGAPPKLGFLYTGQGSQYVNMLRELCAREPVVADTFAEADRVTAPLLGKPLSQFIFVDAADRDAVAASAASLMQTAITQPAVLAADTALTRLLAAYGVRPDMVMGHSLGEYGALVAADALPFEDALEAVSARGREMTNLAVADNGWMAAVFAPIAEVERILGTIAGYVVIANVNSTSQAVIGGATTAVQHAIAAFVQAGYQAVQLPVSHAFHTSIVAPAGEPLRRTLQRLRLQPPKLPIVGNVDGEFYPTGDDVIPRMVHVLGQQIASPVQFVKGLQTLYGAGVRLFVEVGPKKALQGFVDDVFAADGDVASLFTNHPKLGDTVAFNQALCGLYAAGLGMGAPTAQTIAVREQPNAAVDEPADVIEEGVQMKNVPEQPTSAAASIPDDNYVELGRLCADFLERGWQIYRNRAGTRGATEPITITGAALGLPGTERIFDDRNLGRILNGVQCIDVIPTRLRQAMLDKHITRLVKSAEGDHSFETIDSPADVIKLAGRGGHFDLQQEFGVPAERLPALDVVTQLAIGAGLDALRDAGIPLIMRYRTTSTGSRLPERWVLPESIRDDTGVIFASAFPGYDAFAADLTRYHTDRARREQIALLEAVRVRVVEAANGHGLVVNEIDRRLHDLRAAMEAEPYTFDRRFLFRVLAMGHSQFAELVGARGPNTCINAACASTTQAIAVAEDWIRVGRCRRVIVIAADDVTTDNLLEWIGAGFLASGAAATDDAVENAALPFDRRRHGMVLGMGAAAMVLESAAAARERGVLPICEVLGAVTANSAFHGTRLDVDHIRQVMELLLSQAESRCGVRRAQIAQELVFVSHETYTPARGGSAAAEVEALRHVFGSAAGAIVVANTKGLTGHAMGVGIEDVVAIKSLETGIVPPVPNFKETDPELGTLNLSRGGSYPVRYALRLAAGFGSQISLALVRWVPPADGVHRSPDGLGYAYRIVDRPAWDSWLARITGQTPPELEVVKHTLRVKEGDSPARATRSEPLAAISAAPALDLAPGSVSAGEPVFAPPEAGVPAPPAQTASSDAARLQTMETQHASGATEVREQVLALCAEKTGYPPDMLDPELDLEADLGIDTVKQAELFATLREAYGIPRDTTLKLREFPTLAHVIRFVEERRPTAPVPSPTPAAQPAPVPSATPSSGPRESVRERVLALFAEKTGYPPDMLDPDLDLEADLGIDTVKQAELFATLREAYDIPRDTTLKLRDFPTLAHVIRFVEERRPAAAGPSPALAAQPAPVLDRAPNSAPRESVREHVLALFAEKTGYPPDMLDPDLDLEADLGIDTVKQAELFATLRETYNIPRDTTLKLRDLPTLAHVIRFVEERRPNAPVDSSTTTAAAPPPRPVSTPAARPRAAGFEAANQIPRRVPICTPRPPLSLCKSTGVQFTPGMRVLVIMDQGGVGAALGTALQRKGVKARLLDPTTEGEQFNAQVEAFLASGVSGVFWLPALDHEGDVRAMDLRAWRSALHVRLKLLYATMRSAYTPVTQPGTFLIAATRLGGQHGYNEAGAFAPLGGAVAGFTKAYRRERPEALAKVVDFEAEAQPDAVADAILAETERDPAVVEIGYRAGQRWTVRLEEQPLTEAETGLPLTGDTVFVVTGAAGSIVSAITADLAAASGGTFYLIDKVPEPDADNPDLSRFASDRDGLKRDLFERAKARGERATPALVERELAGLERAHAALSAMRAVRDAGGVAHYHSVDLTDAAAVGRVIDGVRDQSGRIDVLVHAAGLEISRFLPEKEPREFNLVFDVKSDGWFNLLRAIGDMPLAAAVVFSSVAGRFGNAGQSDYSAANDLLCKCVSSFRTTRPETRGIAIDWTAWGGIGMASRGSIPKMMEVAGIDMLPPEAAVPIVRRELALGGVTGEVVIGQRLGILLNEWDETGGLETGAIASSGSVTACGPMIGEVRSMRVHDGLRVETMLDPAVQPFLHDHQVDGTPVLPGVMGVEAFAELATGLLPGWRVTEIENVHFLAPFKFYRNEPRVITLCATFRAEGAGILAECRLDGSRSLPMHLESVVTTHFKGRVWLRRQALGSQTVHVPQPANGGAVTAPQIYQIYFHGPAYQVLDRVWSDGARLVALLRQQLSPHHVPSGRRTCIAPRLIEACFQTAGLWEIATAGQLALPQHIDCIRFLGDPEAAAEQRAPLYAVVTPRAGCFDAQIVNAWGEVCLQVSGYRTVTLRAPAITDALAAVQHAMVRAEAGAAVAHA